MDDMSLTLQFWNNDTKMLLAISTDTQRDGHGRHKPTPNLIGYPQVPPKTSSSYSYSVEGAQNILAPLLRGCQVSLQSAISISDFEKKNWQNLSAKAK